VEDADWSTIANEQRIIDVLETVMDQHCLMVSPSVIEEDLDSTEPIDGECGTLYRLCYQVARMVRAKSALAQDDGLDTLAGAVAFCVEHMARDAQLAALDHKGREFDKELDKFVKRVTFQHGHNSIAQVVIWRMGRGKRGAQKPYDSGQGPPGAGRTCHTRVLFSWCCAM
jgi:hypothetical protein